MLRLTTLILLMTLSLNCGGFKVDVGIDDADLDTLTETVESLFGDQADTDGTDTDTSDQTVETVQGETFIGTFDKFADTCSDYALIDNPRVYESADQVILYDINGVVDLTMELYDVDGTLDMTVDGGFGQDNLDCVCEVKSDSSIQCSCESDDADCAVVWGLL